MSATPLDPPVAPPDPPTRMTARDAALLFVLCGSIFLEGVDVSMLGVALPAIRAELGMFATDLQWVVSAYVLTCGGFMLAIFVLFSGLGGPAPRAGR